MNMSHYKPDIFNLANTFGARSALALRGLAGRKPEVFDRDRPLAWNLFGFFATRSKYGVGNEWRHFEQDDGSLTCEECEYAGNKRAVMIVNAPFDPETPVDFDSPTQVLCQECVERELPIDSEYRDGVKSGSTADLTVEDLDSLQDAIESETA